MNFLKKCFSFPEFFYGPYISYVAFIYPFGWLGFVDCTFVVGMTLSYSKECPNYDTKLQLMVVPLKALSMVKKNWCLRYATKLHLKVRLPSCMLEEYWVPLHCNYPISTMTRSSSTYKFSPSGSKRIGVRVKTLNWNWWWGSRPGALRNVEYPFIVTSLIFTLTWSGSTC